MKNLLLILLFILAGCGKAERQRQADALEIRQVLDARAKVRAECILPYSENSKKRPFTAVSQAKV